MNVFFFCLCIDCIPNHLKRSVRRIQSLISVRFYGTDCKNDAVVFSGRSAVTFGFCKFLMVFKLLKTFGIQPHTFQSKAGSCNRYTLHTANVNTSHIIRISMRVTRYNECVHQFWIVRTLYPPPPQ